jgi:hypothetical protein
VISIAAIKLIMLTKLSGLPGYIVQAKQNFEKYAIKQR